MGVDILRTHSNSRMSKSVSYNGVIYLAGVVAEDFSGDIQAQMTSVLRQVDRQLADLGSTKDRILSAQIWLKNLARDFNSMNTVWEPWLTPGCAPARATCQAELGDPNMLVEVILIVAQ